MNIKQQVGYAVLYGVKDVAPGAEREGYPLVETLSDAMRLLTEYLDTETRSMVNLRLIHKEKLEGTCNPLKPYSSLAVSYYVVAPIEETPHTKKHITTIGPVDPVHHNIAVHKVYIVPPLDPDRKITVQTLEEWGAE